MPEMIKDSLARVPKNYSGNKPTARPARVLLPQILRRIQQRTETPSEYVFQVFIDVLGERARGMAVPYKLEKGILFVKVTNAAILSIIMHYEKARILQEMKRILPDAQISQIVCRIKSQE